MKKLIEIIKKTKQAFIILIITFLCGIFFTYLCRYHELKQFLKEAFIYFVPFFLTLILIILTNIYYDKKYTKTFYKIMWFLCCIFFFIYYIFSSLFSLFYELDNPKISIDKYEYFIKDCTSLVRDVFPNKIPDTAKNALFLHNPGFLQGGGRLTLYYDDYNLPISLLDEKYRKKAIYVGKKTKENKDTYPLFEPFYGTLAYNRYDEFTLYLIDEECSPKPNYCNHGTYLVVAICEKTKEIVYEYSYW